MPSQTKRHVFNPDLVAALNVPALKRLMVERGTETILAEIRKLCSPGQGRRKVEGDDVRIEAMARHLAEDADLPEGEGRLSELARRVIRENPGRGDLIGNEVQPKAIARLVRKYDWFSWDLDGRGWDQGKWRIEAADNSGPTGQGAST
jgi:hypothetical protein